MIKERIDELMFQVGYKSTDLETGGKAIQAAVLIIASGCIMPEELMDKKPPTEEKVQADLRSDLMNYLYGPVVDQLRIVRSMSHEPLVQETIGKLINEIIPETN